VRDVADQRDSLVAKLAMETALDHPLADVSGRRLLQLSVSADSFSVAGNALAAAAGEQHEGHHEGVTVAAAGSRTTVPAGVVAPARIGMRCLPLGGARKYPDEPLPLRRTRSVSGAVNDGAHGRVGLPCPTRVAETRVFDGCEGSSIGAIVVVDMPTRNPTSRRGDPRWMGATRRWCEL
jgi:hypothetical protein